MRLSSISVYVKRGELWKGVSNGVSVEPSPHNSLGNGSGARAMATGLWKLARSKNACPGKGPRRPSEVVNLPSRGVVLSLSTGDGLGGPYAWFLVFGAQNGEVFRVQLTAFFDGTEVVIFFAAAPAEAAQRSADELALAAYKVSGFGYGFLQPVHPVTTEVHTLRPGGTRLVHPQFLGHFRFPFCFTRPPLPDTSPWCGAVLGAGE